MNKTVVFDIDDTLCDNSWQRLNTAAGVTDEEDCALYLSYTRGEFNYREWITRLADMYRKQNFLTEKLAREVLGAYVLNNDTEVVVGELKNRGYDIILITGGFDITAEHLGTKLELTHYYATSRLEFNDAGLFTNIITATDDGEDKVTILKKYLKETGKLASDCIAVGDSSNDIPLFNFTKNGICFDWSKDEVKVAARQTISILSDLLEFL